LANSARRNALLEQQLPQTPRVEALGRPTGAITHNLNNVLIVPAAVLSQAELALVGVRSLPPAPFPREGCLTQMERSADHASTVTRQLLMFSRQRATPRKSVHIDSPRCTTLSPRPAATSLS
jgi:signal transduction histidine kinase